VVVTEVMGKVVIKGDNDIHTTTRKKKANWTETTMTMTMTMDMTIAETKVVSTEEGERCTQQILALKLRLKLNLEGDFKLKWVIV
jgi:hypothetical protein